MKKKDKKPLDYKQNVVHLDEKDALAIASSFAVENIQVTPEDLKRKKELESKYPLSETAQ